MKRMKVQWTVRFDSRRDNNWAFSETFNKLKDAQKFVNSMSGKFWEIVRQEYTDFSFGEEVVHSRGYK